MVGSIDLISDFSVEIICGYHSYTNGLAYYKANKVIKLDITDGAISGEVKGRRIYKQHINMPDGLSINRGTCSCPVGINCKHVAALLLAVLDKDKNALMSNKDPDTGLQAMEGEEIASKVIEAEVSEPKVEIGDEAEEWLNGLLGSNNINSSKRQLIYTANIDGGGELTIRAYGVYVKKDGSYGKGRRSFDYNGLKSYAVPTYFTFDDMAICGSIRGSMITHYGYSDGFKINDSSIFKKILVTGRCHYGNISGQVINLGEEKESNVSWKILDDGRQELSCDLEGKGDRIIKMDEAWYFNRADMCAGKIDFGIDRDLCFRLLSAPRLNPLEAEVVSKRIIESGTNIPLPVTFDDVEVKDVAPTPCLVLSQKRIRKGYYDGWITIASARPYFEYEGVKVKKLNRNDVITVYRDRKLIKYSRNHRSEDMFIASLKKVGLVPISQHYIHYSNSEFLDQYDFTMVLRGKHLEKHLDKLESAWMQFMYNDVQSLRDDGWKVIIENDFPYNIVRADSWYSDIDDERSGIEWFSYEFGVSVGGKKINILPILVQALRDSDHMIHESDEDLCDDSLWYFDMSDGSKLAMPSKRISKILSVLKSVYSHKGLDEDGKLRFARHEAANIHDMYEATDPLGEWKSGREIVALGKKLKDFRGIECVEVPDSVDGELRDYQRKGIDWLQFLRKYEFSGILADDMGLGKTVQTLGHIACIKRAGSRGPVLVISPTSVASNWKSEASRFVPSLSVLVLHGSDRKVHFDRIEEYDIVVTTYPLVLRDKDVLLKIDFDTIILDEAQYIKNSNTKVSKLVCKLKSSHKLCLTGTPIENHLSELWSQFHFLMPKFLGSSRDFKEEFRNPIERSRDVEKRKLLVRRIKPFILRRNKKEVLSELPLKTEIIKSVELSSDQRDLYETVRVSMEKKVRDAISLHGVSKSHITVLDALLKLRQICCDPRLLSKDVGMRSSKLDLLIELVLEMIEEGRRILLFLQFVKMIEHIEERLDREQVRYLKLIGSTKDRGDLIDEFQNGDVPLF